MIYLLPALGVFLCISGVALIFLKRELLSTAILILPGIILCCVSVPNLLGVQFSIPGFAGSVTMQQVSNVVRDAQIDIKEGSIGKINSDLQSLREQLNAQEKFNQQIQHNMSVIKTSSGGELQSGQKADITSLSPSFQRYSVYSALVFYRDARLNDSVAIVDRLTASGFQASSINTTLDEAKVGAQPDNSTYLTPNTASPLAGKEPDVLAKLGELVRLSLPSARRAAMTISAPHPLKRGDVQIYLY